MRIITFATIIFTFLVNPVFATDKDYSQAAGHTGVYVNVQNVSALKCRIITYDLTKQNNKLGWYTSWPMIVDYKTGKFVQIGYITSPQEGIDAPTFYVAWSSDGKQVNLKYLPSKESNGNALEYGNNHEYALSLNSDGSANIQIDGKKYLDSLEDRINVGITEGTGEFFSEGSNINIDITSKFTDCFYKIRAGENKWISLETDKKNLLYYVSHGTSIEKIEDNAFIIKGRIKKINKGMFFKKIHNIKTNETSIENKSPKLTPPNINKKN
ncbi:MAG: hypothetical protein U0354_09930 [Candidatus Sericytochromatia bacterium]